MVGEGDKPIDAYLDIEDIIRICKEHDVDAFIRATASLLKMRSSLSAAKEEGIIFIGPKVEHLIMFGDKVKCPHSGRKSADPDDPGDQGRGSQL